MGFISSLFLLALGTVMIAGVSYALIGTVGFLHSHRGIAVVVALAAVALGIVIGIQAITWVSWEPVAKKLAPWARDVDPEKENLLPFNNFASSGSGFERYLSISPKERQKAVSELIRRLGGLPDPQRWGIPPGSSHFDINLELQQLHSYRRHSLDNDGTLIALQAASLNALQRESESQTSPSVNFQSPDFYPALMFLARLAHQGNHDASRELALLLSKEKPEPRSLIEESSCRSLMKEVFQLDGTDCNRYEPYSGSGPFAVIYRRFTDAQRRK